MRVQYSSTKTGTTNRTGSEMSYKEIRWDSLRESNVCPWISNVKSNGNIQEYKLVANNGE